MIFPQSNPQDLSGYTLVPGANGGYTLQPAQQRSMANKSAQQPQIATAGRSPATGLPMRANPPVGLGPEAGQLQNLIANRIQPQRGQPQLNAGFGQLMRPTQRPQLNPTQLQQMISPAAMAGGA